MEELKISKENALKAYEEAHPEGRKLLSDLFGKKVFQKDVTERIKTYEDACEEIGIKPLKLSDFDFLPEIDREYHYHDHRRVVVTRVLNEGWVADYDDPNQRKYTVWYKKVGSGFVFYYCASGHSYSLVGARHSFKSLELAEYFASQFIGDINKCFIVEN